MKTSQATLVIIGLGLCSLFFSTTAFSDDKAETAMNKKDMESSMMADGNDKTVMIKPMAAGMADSTKSDMEKTMATGMADSAKSDMEKPMAAGMADSTKSDMEKTMTDETKMME